MTGSAVPAVIDALVASLTSALPNVLVIDGPGATDANATNVVHVGLSDADDGDYSEAAVSEQRWAWLGHTQRDETFRVRCDAVAWNGDGNMKAARDAVYATLTAVTAAITTDPSLGGSALYTIGVSSHELLQIQDRDSGAAARLPFDVECRARLT